MELPGLDANARVIAVAFGNDTNKAYRLGSWLGNRYGSRSHVLWIVAGEYDSISNWTNPIDPAKKAQKGHEAVKPLKAAEAWLKQAASDIRNDRFAPIKGKAQQIWNQLRLQSNVSLEDIRLSEIGRAHV